jgi:PTS system mannose-specific IIA component
VAAVRAVIVTHGSLGSALIEVVGTMLGPPRRCEVVSNEGLSLDQLIGTVGIHLDGTPTVMFSDFCGGSAYAACRALQERHPETAVVSGVNLPMLLSFFTKRDKLPFSELVAVVETDGHRGIQRIVA